MLFLRFITNVKRKTKLSERLVVLFSFYYSGIKYYGHIINKKTKSILVNSILNTD